MSPISGLVRENRELNSRIVLFEFLSTR